MLTRLQEAAYFLLVDRWFQSVVCAHSSESKVPLHCHVKPQGNSWPYCGIDMNCHSIRLFLGPLFQGKGCCFLGEGTGPLDSSERFYVFFVFHLLVGTKLS